METSRVLREWIHGPKRDDEDTLDIPFSAHELQLALDGTTYDFQAWNGIVSCASWLDVTIRPETVRMAQMFTIECIRASGMNPAHFQEASLFSHALSHHDSRFTPMDYETLEQLYWGLLTSQTNLESFFQSHLGGSVYNTTVADVRAFREHLQNPPMVRMTSTH